jgi:hypothetical protein
MDWNALIKGTWQLYQQAALDTWQKVQQHWMVGLLPLLYAPIFFFTAVFATSLGPLGGLVLGLVLALCTSSYLYFLGEVMNGRRVAWRDLPQSWRPFLSSVITVLFFFFLVRLAARFLLAPIPSAAVIWTVLNLVLLVVVNPIPEIIYQGRSEGFAMLQESVEFLRESGVEWFLPLIALAAFSFFFFPLPVLILSLEIGRLTFPALGSGAFFTGSFADLAWAIVSAFLLFALMVFRGLLFRALAGGTRRQRIFRARSS